MRYVEFSYSSAILSCRFFADSDHTHRALLRSYGKYILTTSQTCAFDWVNDTWAYNDVAVLLQTTPVLIEPFVRTLKEVSSIQ